MRNNYTDHGKESGSDLQDGDYLRNVDNASGKYSELSDTQDDSSQEQDVLSRDYQPSNWEKACLISQQSKVSAPIDAKSRKSRSPSLGDFLNQNRDGRISFDIDENINTTSSAHQQPDNGASERKKENKMKLSDNLTSPHNQSSLNMGDHHTFVSALTEGTFRTEGVSRATSTRLYGRQEELDRMLQAYTDVCEPLWLTSQNAKSLIIPTARRTVLLHGPAGIGKTALVEKILRNQILQKGGHFVLGKFSKTKSVASGPYPALVAALTDFCDLLAQHPDFRSSKQAKLLKKLRQEDTKRLGLLIGNLHRLTGALKRTESTKKSLIAGGEKLGDGEQQFSTQTQADETASLSSSLADIHSSLRKFFRAVTSAEHPLCLCIDDLQWADLPSLELLQLMASGRVSHSSNIKKLQQPHVLMICISREVTSNMLHRLSRKEIKCIDMIEMKNLGIGGINDIVADKLQMDAASTHSLSKIIMRKTGGNPSYVLQYFNQLRNDGYLKRKLEETRWIWNPSRIQAETDVTQNVLEIAARKIPQNSKYVQLVLKVASAIGFKFDKRLLEAIVFAECQKAIEGEVNGNYQKTLQQSISNSNMRTKVNKCLARALKAHIIEKTGFSGEYKFSHVSLREQVLQMISEGKEREDLHFQIGKCLKQKISNLSPDTSTDWMIFSMADQLNQAGENTANPLESMELMRANVQAARLACDKGAFQVAVDYLRSAQAVVEMSIFFKGQHETAKSLLYTFIAEMEYAIGDFPRCQEAARMVLAYEINPASKIDAFRALFDALDVQGNGNEAVHIALQFLHKFNKSFLEDANKLQMLSEFINTRNKIVTLPDEELINLPEILDDEKANDLKVISAFCTMAPINRNEFLFHFSILHVIKLSLQYGVAAISTYAFGNFGTLLASMGHFHEAFRFGNVALRMLERFHVPPNVQAHTIAVIHGGCQHWGKNIKESLQPLMKAYETGKTVGDIKCSWMCAYNYLVGSLESGVKLSQVEIDIRVFCKGLDDMSPRNAVRIMITSLWQKVLNLMGDGDPLQLIGRAMTKSQLDTVVKCGTLFLASAQLSLAYHFDALKVAEQLCELLEANERAICW
eukprot:CAMPEP_0194152710 /NCGR_PEP_ID=MMETSP0152-20130528/53602_1 /TAXON_ID=1049557 /ORGANISM="Thalassiothrix antarctica, Strain L6-D1" /LENGTH=1088 /DNA_ID=CAMNT_0038857439 /DNA_START=88 /DNA_END=3351 /DNA_ORIENTATION=+